MIEEDEHHPIQAFSAPGSLTKWNQPNHVQFHRRRIHFDTLEETGNVLITVVDVKTARVMRRIDSGDLLKIAWWYELQS